MIKSPRRSSVCISIINKDMRNIREENLHANISSFQLTLLLRAPSPTSELLSDMMSQSIAHFKRTVPFRFCALLAVLEKFYVKSALKE